MSPLGRKLSYLVVGKCEARCCRSLGGGDGHASGQEGARKDRRAGEAGGDGPLEGLVGGAGDVWTRKLFEAFQSSSPPRTWSPPLHKAISSWCQPYLCSISLGSSRCIHRPPALRDRGGFMGGHGGGGASFRGGLRGLLGKSGVGSC